MKPKLELGETVRARDFGEESTAVPDGSGERYERRSLLGRGGMGEVHLCFDKLVGREIAMKTILPNVREAGIARFVREAKVQARLEHPSIVPVYDIGTREDGTVWFTMKRVKGRSLEEILDALAAADVDVRAQFSRRKLLAAFVAVCYAVAFAHEHGVVHRDLKPSNIMLGSFGEVSVLDWGVAKLDDSADERASEIIADLASGARKTEQGLAVGTPGYMSPEQARGERAGVGPASDVYALGAILFEILAERPLHVGATSAELLVSTLAGVDARPSSHNTDVPPELDAICVAATKAESAERTQSARELATSVERYLDGDRDLERRRELAAQHTEAAKRALDSDATRTKALLELGRALALDPENATARDLMAKLMMTPPAEVPPEARAELEAERDRARVGAARAGALRYLSWCAFAVLLFWMGVRDWPLTLVVLGFMAASSAFAFWRARLAKVGRRSMLVLLVTSSITVALASALCGPFIVVPTLAATNAMYFAMTMERRHRVWALVAAIGAIVVPFVLDVTHVTAPWSDLGASTDSFRVLARPIHFPAIPTQVMLLATAVGTAIIPVVMIGRMRDALTRAEERLFLQAWQLRATLPSEAQAPLVSRSHISARRRRDRPRRAASP